MYKLGYIGKAQYLIAKDEPITISQLEVNFPLDGRFIAEITRQAMIERYGLSVYKDGLSVFTTLDSKLQQAALNGIYKNLYEYDKRHGWREPISVLKRIPEIFFDELKDNVKAITPVPGGVGPMTIACLLKNTLTCFKARLT